MNWKLIFGLSFFGLIVVFTTAYFIPSTSAPIIACSGIFVIWAYLAAKYAFGKYFWHGFCIILANCVWVVAARILLFSTNIVKHTRELDIRNKIEILHGHSRLELIIMGLIGTIAFAVVLGLFCVIASKEVTKKA